MITTVRKWGNSLGVRIPKSVAHEAQVEEGMKVDIREEDDRLVITPVERTSYKLETLLRAVSPRNLHRETDFGKPEGREAW